MLRTVKINWNSLIFLLALWFAPVLRAQTPFDFKEFSATMSGALSGPDFETKVYREGDLIRVDMGAHYIVTDLAALTSYGYFPKTNSCLKNSAPQSGSIPFSMLKDAQVSHVPVGEEAVDGHPCKVEDVTIAHEGRPAVKLRVWEAQDLRGFPIKIVRTPQIQMNPGAKPAPERTLLYRDVHLEAPDASLFTHPEHCDPGPQAPARQR